MQDKDALRFSKLQNALEGHPRARILARRYQALQTPAEQRLFIQQRQNVRLREEVKEAERSATIDSLTGLYNRRGGIASYEMVLASAKRAGQLVACLMLDLDFFKRVNDTYGHGAGDAVLQEFARRLSEPADQRPATSTTPQNKPLRNTDVVFRYGGEEFCVLMQVAQAGGAALVTERLRHSIGDEPFLIRDNDGKEHALYQTVSIGVATADPTDPDNAASLVFETLKDKADKALYTSKEKGRNRTSFALGPNVPRNPIPTGQGIQSIDEDSDPVNVATHPEARLPITQEELSFLLRGKYPAATIG